MYKFSVLIVSLVAFSAADAGKLPTLHEPSPVLKEMIYQTNLNLAKENRSVLSVEDFSLNYLIGKISLQNSLAGNFSTLVLVGEDQFFNQTDGAKHGTMYSIDINLGVEELYMQSDLYFSVLIPFVNSRVKISNRNLTLRVKGSILSIDLSHCNATMDTVEVTGLGDFEVTFLPSGITTFIPKHIIQFFLNYIVPLFKSVVNSKISNIIQQDEVKSEFQARACEQLIMM